MIATIFVVSLIGAFVSGLLGLGGAVLLIPLFLTVPRWLGVGELSIHQVSGLTMLQVLAASSLAWFAHHRQGFGHLGVTLCIGIPLGMFSFVGAAVSKTMPDVALHLIFGCLVIFSFLLLMKGTPSETIESTTFDFRRWPSIGTGIGVGFLAGVIGAGGGFVLMPIMIKLLKIPIRVAVCSSLGIICLGAILGALGKILTFQVEWSYLLPVLGGSLPGSFVGAAVSRRIAPRRLRHLLLLLLLGILVKTWYDLICLLLGGR